MTLEEKKKKNDYTVCYYKKILHIHEKKSSLKI